MSCDHEARFASIDKNFDRLFEGQGKVSTELALATNELRHIKEGVNDIKAGGHELLGRVGQLEQFRSEHEGEHEGSGRTGGLMWSAIKVGLAALTLLSGWALFAIAQLLAKEGG